VSERPPGGGTFDEAGDATRRTFLANERTSMAWWRTGLTSVAVGLGIGKLLPDVGDAHTRWPYAAIGLAYALIGVVMMAYGTIRHRDVDEAVRRGEFAHPAPAFLWAITGLGAVLGVLTAVLIVVEP
jgi:putative membrane protein